jgi:hypothetical protein
MIRSVKLAPVLVGVAGAMALAIVNCISWVFLVFTNKQIQNGMRADFQNLEALSNKGVYAAEVMLSGGAVGLLLAALNFLVLPLGLGFLISKFAEGSESLHGAILSIGLFTLWSLGALTSIPAEPLPIGSPAGLWISLGLYAVSALSIYVGAVVVGRR